MFYIENVIKIKLKYLGQFINIYVGLILYIFSISNELQRNHLKQQFLNNILLIFT